MSSIQQSASGKSKIAGSQRVAVYERLDRLQIESTLEAVAQRVPELWALDQWVAVNPWEGFSEGHFWQARQTLRQFADVEMLLPLSHYQQAYHAGRLSLAAIHEAHQEHWSQGLLPLSIEERISREELMALLHDEHAAQNEHSTNGGSHRTWMTLCEHLDSARETQWNDWVIGEMSKHLGSYYDRAQAQVKNPWQGETLFHAWLSAAQHDWRPMFAGVRKFRETLAELPRENYLAINYLLDRLDVSESAWQSVLSATAYSVLGWASWAKHQHGRDDLIDVIAIRLAYDYAIAKATQFRVDWDSYAKHAKTQPVAKSEVARYVLLRATEIERHREMLGKLAMVDLPGKQTVDPSVKKSPVQMVFCIDVRSERFRRHLEKVSADEVTTSGCAGFFGLPISYQTIEGKRERLAPAILNPAFTVKEEIFQNREDDREGKHAIQRVRDRRRWAELWDEFRKSHMGGFAIVESFGLGYLWKLVTGRDVLSKLGVSEVQAGPTLRGLSEQGLSTSRQVDLAAELLKQMGSHHIDQTLVVICGHHCETENNPLAAGLQCGACGGHGGEANARTAAMLLNQNYVRMGLRDRGFEIGAGTRFIAATHNTTTDTIRFFADGDLDASQAACLAELQKWCCQAGDLVRMERSESLREAGWLPPDRALIEQAASDWSEIRPEWGLAGNRAMFIGPRPLTAGANLQGECFLHSYDFHLDPDGELLGRILAGPLMVGVMINTQYYASTVDPSLYGAGEKNLHNIVGGFGVLEGGGGAPRLGLAWQSVSDGTRLRHEPQRLHAYIAAPAEFVNRAIASNPILRQMLAGEWLYLFTRERDGSWRNYRLTDCRRDAHRDIVEETA